MDSSPATTVDEYLASLPPDRRDSISRVREVVRSNLPAGYEEGIQYGMISWFVPLSRFPETYNGQPLAIASLGSQKNYMALYLMGVYADPAIDLWFRNEFKNAGKKLDMGKSCVRFRTLDTLALDVIAETIRMISVDAFLANYHKTRAATLDAKLGDKPTDASAAKTAAIKASATKTAAIKASATKTAAIKAAATRTPPRGVATKPAPASAATKSAPAKAATKPAPARSPTKSAPTKR